MKDWGEEKETYPAECIVRSTLETWRIGLLGARGSFYRSLRGQLELRGGKVSGFGEFGERDKTYSRLSENPYSTNLWLVRAWPWFGLSRRG